MAVHLVPVVRLAGAATVSDSDERRVLPVVWERAGIESTPRASRDYERSARSLHPTKRAPVGLQSTEAGDPPQRAGMRTTTSVPRTIRVQGPAARALAVVEGHTMTVTASAIEQQDYAAAWRLLDQQGDETLHTLLRLINAIYRDANDSSFVRQAARQAYSLAVQLQIQDAREDDSVLALAALAPVIRQHGRAATLGVELLLTGRGER